MCEKKASDVDSYGHFAGGGLEQVFDGLFVVCPECDGKGRKFYMERIYRDAWPGDNKKHRVELPCKKCFGRKVIPTEAGGTLLELFGTFYRFRNER
jgi:hypothetical protein